MNRLFWPIAAVFLAITVHAAFVLMVPSFALERNVARISNKAGPNAFFVLPPEEQSRLFPTYPRFSVIGACAFDVSTSKVNLSANMPAGYWTLTIYSSSGEVIYALNDTQSGTGNFTVSLSKAPGLLEMLTQTGQDDVRNTTGWTVSAIDPKGIAVLWQPVPDPGQRAGVVRAFETSTCTAAS
jgi:uncharacterized membrane protein